MLNMENKNDISTLTAYMSTYIKMDEKEIDFLSKHTLCKTYKKKETIHQEGDIQRYLAFVIQGAVRFFYIDEKGKEHTIDFAFENTLIGNYKILLSTIPAPFSVEPIEPSTLLGISKENLLAFMNQFPRYYPVITNLLGEALIDNEVRNKLLRLTSSRERYQKLCTLRPKVAQRVPLTHIASYLKMALGTLSRVRAGKL